MMKLAYALGAQHACEALGIKVAKTPASMGIGLGRQPTWGLGGKTPGGFTQAPQGPASSQAGAQPGGPPQLDAAPKATPPTQPAPSPGAVAPAVNPTIKQPGATGITAPLEAKAIPGAGGSPAAAPKSTATRTGTDVADVAARTGGKPF